MQDLDLVHKINSTAEINKLAKDSRDVIGNVVQHLINYNITYATLRGTKEEGNILIYNPGLKRVAVLSCVDFYQMVSGTYENEDKLKQLREIYSLPNPELPIDLY